MTISAVQTDNPENYGRVYTFGEVGDVLGIGGGFDASLINQVSLMRGRILAKTSNTELVIGEILEHSEIDMREFEAIEAGSQLFNSVKQTQALE